jgi:aspartate/methionine/tyrosine aminotransferase
VIDSGDEILLETPNYEALQRVPTNIGAEVKMIERRFDRNWQIDLEELERRVSRRTKAILMTNLHNPSGTATNPDKMLTIGQIARDHGARVIVSEVYLDSCFAQGHKPAVSYGEHLISIGSLSKVYGLGGLRVGWIVADDEVIERIKVAQDYVMGGLSSPSQSLALHALSKSDVLVNRCRQIVQGNVKVLGEWIRKHPHLSWIEPDGGTVALVKLPPNLDAMALSNYTREKYSTLVAPGDFFGLRGFIRVALGIDEEVLRNGLKHLGSAIDHFRGTGR